ncbi:MAG TPA: hypothetical protein PKZ32_01290 [Candidatus Melainabacteria bacterium]|nr:hypothetical protein [Candidatus Melainabacteria bacterium]
MKVVLYALLALLLSNDSAAAVTGSNSGTRIIDFPARGLGKYYIYDNKESFLLQWPDFAERKLASGRVIVAVDAQVGVETYWCTGDCLPDLRFLKPGDIQALDVDGSVLTHSGVKYICRLTGLKKLVLEGTDADDRDIELIARKLPALPELNIGYTRISKKALASISKMRNLRKISLEKDRIDSSSIEKLSVLPNLLELNLKQVNVDDQVFEGLSKCKKLTALNLAKTRITDNGLAAFSRMQSLRKLDISDCRISDAAVCSVIANMENLEELNLSGTSVTDRGVKSLTKLKHLRKLWLRDLRNVSDAAIPSLISHKELQDLELQKTSISSNGVKRLAQSLPTSEIHLHALCKCRKQSRVN